MQVVLLFLLAVFASFFFLKLGQSQNEPVVVAQTRSIVTEVIDGDTIKISGGQTLRFIGIDTPELAHRKRPLECFAKEAKNKTQKLLLGRRVRMEKDISETDRFGRLLRYVYVDDTFINELLVKEGYATVATLPPDVKYIKELHQAEGDARKNSAGLWNYCNSTINLQSSLSIFHPQSSIF